jgi:proline- and glutamine-rich splicing factor
VYREREVGPRFAAPNTFELMFGQRWKELYEMEKVKREQLEAELKESRDRLEQDMELAYQDYQTHLLREGKLSNLVTMIMSDPKYFGRCGDKICI